MSALRGVSRKERFRSRICSRRSRSRERDHADFAAVFLVPSALVAALIADKRGQRKAALAAVLFAIAGVVNIAYTSQKISSALEGLERFRP